MAVMLYILGLSYRAVEIVLHGLGMGIGKTSAFRAVQAVIKQVPGLKREQLLNGYKKTAVGADVTFGLYRGVADGRDRCRCDKRDDIEYR
jgi:hypothetical protein